MRETTSPVLGLIIYLLVFGTVAGYIARLLVPNPDPMGFGATVLLGIVGAIIALLIFRGTWGRRARASLR